MGKTWPVVVKAARPQFVINAVMAAAVGSAAGWRVAARPSAAALAATLAAAAAIHAATNAADDYFDYRRRWDSGTVPDEFSGGSGILPRRQAAARDVWHLSLVLYAVAVLLGAYLVASRGWPVGVLGLGALALSVAYTGGRRPLVARGAGEAGLAGSWLLAALTGYWVQAQSFAWTPLLVALPVAWPTNLLANEIPDYPEDRAAGKANLVVRLGPVGAARLYAGLMAAQPLSLVIAVAVGAAPVGALAGLLAVPWALTAVRLILAAPTDYGAQYPARVRTAAARQLVAASLLAGLVLTTGVPPYVTVAVVLAWVAVYARLAARVARA